MDGLIKVGKTSTSNFSNRMYDLEHNGYWNVTGLKREFAIEVEEYSEKEILLQTIFAKSRIASTELFALDKNIVIQLLSAFEGVIVFPETVDKDIIFDDATDNNESRILPDGVYKLERKKISDNKMVRVTAIVNNGEWTLLKGSILGITEDKGVSQKAKNIRMKLPMDSQGRLLEDAKLGRCSPSHAGSIVMNQSNNGWTAWKNTEGKTVDIYRRMLK